MAKEILFVSKVKKARGIALAAWATGLRSITKEVKADVQALIDTPYPPASRPFQPPHSRRGSKGLQGSITVVVVPGTKGRAAALVVKSTKDYANYVDKGTSKMKPRPFSKRALTGGRRKETLSKKWLTKIERAARRKAGVRTKGR